MISVPLFYLKRCCDFVLEDSKWKRPNAQSTELTSVLKFLALRKVYLEAVVKGQLYSKCILNVMESYGKDLRLQFCKDKNFPREP